MLPPSELRFTLCARVLDLLLILQNSPKETWAPGRRPRASSEDNAVKHVATHSPLQPLRIFHR